MYNSTVDVGDEIPSFNLDSHAFDPVSTTDLGMLAKLSDEFESRNVFVVAVGSDTVPNYRRWIRDIEELQTVKLNFALLADPDCTVLKMLGCARESVLSGEARSSSSGAFLIDIDKRVRTSSRYSPLIGRNWYEVLRQLDALAVATTHRMVCPSNWGQGQEVLLHRDISPEEAAQHRFVEIRPWFKLSPCPES